MAQVTNPHRSPPSPSSRRSLFTAADEPLPPHHREFYHHLNPFSFDFELFSPPNRSSNPSFFDDYATSFDFGFDLNPIDETADSESEAPNCLFIGGEDDDEQMNFVTDLFESRQSSHREDPIWASDIQAAAEVPPPEFGFGPGLRVVDMDSESDSEEFEVTLNSELLDSDNDNYGNGNTNNSGYTINRNLYLSDENLREDFDWEEVTERVHSEEGENLNSLINRIEEIWVSSSESGNSTTPDEIYQEMELQSIDWEVLLAVNNLERDLHNLTGSSGSRTIETNPPNLQEDFESLLGALLDSENAGKGSPPAAISCVERLATVVITKEEVAGTLVCAVCKEEFVVGDKATRMPCGHIYHGGCIFPWLKIRNTCPVCRHELPTDNAEYEKMRRERRGRDLAARYHFQLMP